MRSLISLLGLVSGVALGVACAPSPNAPFQEGAGGEGSSGGDGGATSGEGGSGGDSQLPGTGGGGPPSCVSGADEDKDGDGWTVAEGDCNDCDPNVNPNAVEVIDDEPDEDGNVPEPADEDCDGLVDNVAPTCDAGLAVGDPDPMNGARAVDLCQVATEANGKPLWGVVDAKWVMADGAPPPTNATHLANFHLGHGLLNGFGPNVKVRRGERMLGVSSGYARQITDAEYKTGSFSKGYTGNHPQGFPKESPSCPGVTTGACNDATALELTIRTPSNAYGFSFDFNFYTKEWSTFVCSTWNDFFVAILSPVPSGQTDGNISYDIQGNPVSVNNAFLEVCGPPGTYKGKTFTCPLGTSELEGTHFVGNGATSWLVTTAPAQPNSTITIRWATYDSGDHILDSSTLVDNWRWIAEAGTTVGTAPVPK